MDGCHRSQPDRLSLAIVDCIAFQRASRLLLLHHRAVWFRLSVWRVGAALISLTRPPHQPNDRIIAMHRQDCQRACHNSRKIIGWHKTENRSSDDDWKSSGAGGSQLVHVQPASVPSPGVPACASMHCLAPCVPASSSADRGRARACDASVCRMQCVYQRASMQSVCQAGHSNDRQRAGGRHGRAGGRHGGPWAWIVIDVPPDNFVIKPQTQMIMGGSKSSSGQSIESSPVNFFM